MDNSKCLICGDVSSPKTIQINDSKWNNNDHKNVCEKLKAELSVVLLLRKILRISRVHLESLLQKYGDPSTWGVNLCSPCNRVFIEAQFVHERILKLHNEFDELASNLRKHVSIIVNDGRSESVSVPLHMGEDNRITRKRGRQKRKKVRFVVTQCQSLRSGPLESIRQELFKVSAAKDATNPPTEASPLSTVIFPKQENLSSIGIVKVETFGDFFVGDPSRETLSTDDDNNNNIIGEVQNQNTHVVASNGQGNEDDFYADNEDFIDDEDSAYLPDTNGDDVNNDGDNQEADNVDKNDSETRRPRRKIVKEVPSTSCAGKNDNIDPFSGPQPIKLKKGYYKCPICARKALSKSSSHGHILRAHYDVHKPFHCHLCRASFKREVRLRQHLEDEHNCSTTPLDDPEEQNQQSQASLSLPSNRRGPRIFECDICPKMKYRVTYKSQETLEAHKKLVHLGIKRPYTCKICDKSFKLHGVLRHHMFVHQRLEKEKKVSEATRKPFCHECNRSFKNMMTLEAHLTTKLHLQPQESPYQCELCPKGFYQKQSLANHHAQEHFEELGLQPFKCTFCGNGLSSQRALDHHIRIRHTKDTLFRCEPCDLGFMTENNYSRHLLVVHSKEKTFLCSYCPKRFSTNNHLETHIRVHTGEKPYKCPHCSKEYSDRPTYKRHLEIHGERVYKCTICEDKQFKVWQQYRLHMKTHNEEVYKRPPQKISCRTSAVVLKGDLPITEMKKEAVSQGHEVPNQEDQRLADDSGPELSRHNI